MNRFNGYSDPQNAGTNRNDIENPLIDTRLFIRNNTPYPTGQVVNRANQYLPHFVNENQQDSPYPTNIYVDPLARQGYPNIGPANVIYPHLSSEVTQIKAYDFGANPHTHPTLNPRSIFADDQSTQITPNPRNAVTANPQNVETAPPHDTRLGAIYQTCPYCGFTGFTSTQEEPDKTLFALIICVIVLSFFFLPILVILCCLLPKFATQRVLAHNCIQCKKQINESPFVRNV